MDSFSFNLSKFQPHLCTSAAPIKRVPSPFRGRGTACGGRGQYVICEAHNSKQKRIRRSAAKIEGVTAHLLSLVFLFARRLEKSLLHPSEQKTSQPSALVVIIDCSALWLQICHRHICLTRRAPYKGKPHCSLHRRTISISVILYPSDLAALGHLPLGKGGNALHYGDPHLFTCYIHLYVLKFMQYPIGFL